MSQHAVLPAAPQGLGPFPSLYSTLSDWPVLCPTFCSSTLSILCLAVWQFFRVLYPGITSFVTACCVALTRIGAIGISLFQSVPKHFLPLFYAWLSVSSPQGMLSTTSYVTTCQNWRSSNSRRHPPVQSTSEEHLSSRPVNQNRQIGSAQPIGTSNEVVPPPSQNIHGFGWSLQ